MYKPTKDARCDVQHVFSIKFHNKVNRKKNFGFAPFLHSRILSINKLELLIWEKFILRVSIQNIIYYGYYNAFRQTGCSLNPSISFSKIDNPVQVI